MIFLNVIMTIHTQKEVFYLSPSSSSHSHKKTSIFLSDCVVLPVIFAFLFLRIKVNFQNICILEILKKIWKVNKAREGSLFSNLIFVCQI